MWGEMTNTHNELCDYEHNTEAAAKELDAATPTALYEEIVVTDTLNINNKELVTTDTLATHNGELDATITCREVPYREESQDSAESQVQVRYHHG